MPSNNRPATRTTIAAQLAVFLLAAAILIPAVTPGAAVTGGPWIKLAFLVRIAALVAFAQWMLRTHSLGWSDVGLSRPGWRRFMIAVPVGGAMTILFATIAHSLAVRAGLPAPNYSMFAPVRGNLGEYLFWVLPVTIGTAAFGEELIFRGFVTDAVRRLAGGSSPVALSTAIIGQALIFGGLHFYQGPGGMIVAGATGLGLGLTWLIAGCNLWAGIVIHALLDGSAMTAIYLGYVAT